MNIYYIKLFALVETGDEDLEDAISFKEVLQLLKKRLLFILSVTLLAGMASGLFSYFFITPIFQSSTKLLINQTNDNQRTMNSGEIQVQANLQLIDTYNEIIKSSRILGKVAEKLASGITVEELTEQISVEKSENSQVVTIVVKDASAEQAAIIADTTAAVFQTEIVNIMKIDNVNILDAATVSNKPVEPNMLKIIAIALVIGFLAGIVIACLLDYLDNTLKSESDIEKELGIPVLGNIAIIKDVEKEKKRNRKTANKSRVRSENLGS